MEQAQEMSEDRLRALWASVLLVSVKDARDYLKKNKLLVLPTGLEIPGDAGEAFRWLTSPSNRAGGFLWVCSVLDLNPEYALTSIARPRMAESKTLKRLKDFVKEDEE